MTLKHTTPKYTAAFAHAYATLPCRSLEMLEKTRPVDRDACSVLQEMMRRALMYDDSVRWARCLAEVMRTASVMCPASPRAAYTEIVSRLQASVSGCTYRAHRGLCVSTI